MRAMKAEFSLNKICSVSTGFEGDSFVGVKMSGDVPKVCFPLGFSLSDSEKELRKDIVLLIKVLRTFHRRDEESRAPSYRETALLDFPLFAYQRMMLHYMNYGSVFEIENAYVGAKTGKISWGRTIKQKQPIYQDNGPVYLDYIVKKSVSAQDSVLSEIYNYCVYCAFNTIGWLYTDKQFRKPKIKFNKKMFAAVVKEKLDLSYTDARKELFSDMIAIINDQGNEGFKQKDYIYGTYEFEYIWEKIVDRAYGIGDKKKYFPRTYWHLSSDRDNHALEPDTIMLHGSDIYVLDAKYYRYGVTGNPSHLPDTSSIQKQITYGEYIDTHSEAFSADRIFNAFLMPADLYSGRFKCDATVSYVGYADSDWKKNDKTYEKVAAILVDTKSLMKNYLKNSSLVDELAKIICYHISAIK